MAITGNLPPQAYTRETLVKAIEWLSTQPQAVRERANSADLVVSFYLAACRKAATMEAPKSHENFKADLKHLREDLRQFEDPSPSQAPNRSPSYGFTNNGDEYRPPVDDGGYRQEPIPLHNHYPQARFESQMIPQQHAPQPQQAQPPAQAQPRAVQWTVDGRSLHAARELQQRLNLGSEAEALRMLVQLGLEKARELLP